MFKEHHGENDMSSFQDECAKLDPAEEKAMAEEGLAQDYQNWPEYEVKGKSNWVWLFRLFQYGGLFLGIYGAILFNSHPKIDHPTQAYGSCLLLIGLGIFFLTSIFRINDWMTRISSRSNQKSKSSNAHTA
jgi:hypothetical protein